MERRRGFLIRQRCIRWGSADAIHRSRSAITMGSEAAERAGLSLSCPATMAASTPIRRSPLTSSSTRTPTVLCRAALLNEYGGTLAR